MHPALGLLELTGIARGMVVCDALVKRAAVQVLRSHPIDPGKYVIVFAGPVADVEEAMEAGEESGSQTIIDRLLIPNVHDALIPAIRGRNAAVDVQSVGIVETHTLAGAVVSLDRALKMAQIDCLELRLGAGLGGKGFYVVTGELHDVEAGIEAALEFAGPGVSSEVIASPHPDFVSTAL